MSLQSIFDAEIACQNAVKAVSIEIRKTFPKGTKLECFVCGRWIKCIIKYAFVQHDPLDVCVCVVNPLNGAELYVDGRSGNLRLPDEEPVLDKTVKAALSALDKGEVTHG